MNIKEVYEKYKHLDKLMSSKDVLNDTFKDCILRDIWKAIKAEAEKK